MKNRLIPLVVLILLLSVGYLFLKTLGQGAAPVEEQESGLFLPEERYEDIVSVLAEPSSYEGEVIALKANIFRVRNVEDRTYLWLDDGTGTIAAEYEGDVKVKEGDSGIIRGRLERDYVLAGGHPVPIVIKVSELDINPEKFALLNISDIRQHRTFLPSDPLGIMGKVVDIKDGRGVTFIELDDGTGRMWALVPAAELEIGDVRRVTGVLELDFRTSSSEEGFDAIIVTDDGARILAMHESETERPEEEIVPIVPLADGGLRICEVLNSSATLENRSVKVRAVLKNVMPLKSYLFLTLDDGTGELKGRYLEEVDLEPGGEIVVTGNVSTGVELGSGYFYDVLLEVESIETP